MPNRQQEFKKSTIKMLFDNMVELFFDYNLFKNNNYEHTILRYLMDITLYPPWISSNIKNDYSHLYAVNIQDFIW